MDNKKEILQALFNDVKKEFALEEGKERLRLFNDTRVELIECQLLMEHLDSVQADDDDKMKLLKYMVVVMNEEKDNLDTIRAYEVLGIDDIIDKYIGGDLIDET